MAFMYNGKKFILKGNKQDTLHWMTRKECSKNMISNVAELASLSYLAYLMTTTVVVHEEDFGAELDHLLDSFIDAFKIPTALPPHKEQDHTIVLQEGTQLINDKFLKPVIEELIDERHGSKISSKLDLSQPLTTLLKKNSFGWNAQDEEAFKVLKQAMIEATVLALLDFQFEFTIETNALDQRITTPFQNKWLPKLLGFSYDKTFKKGSDNAAEDALSRLPNNEEFNAIILYEIDDKLMTKIKESWL
nr:transposon Ty3-G Gag-Pol polyprotein [Tanacetum cinerariifolium]